MVKGARTDPVGASLVFLDLLEGEAEFLGQLLLAHAQLAAAQPHARTDIDIDWMRRARLAPRSSEWGHEGSRAVGGCERDSSYDSMRSSAVCNFRGLPPARVAVER